MRDSLRQRCDTNDKMTWQYKVQNCLLCVLTAVNTPIRFGIEQASADYLHAHVLELHCIFQSCIQNLLNILEIALYYMNVHKALAKMRLPSMEVNPVQPALDIRILMSSGRKSNFQLAGHCRSFRMQQGHLSADFCPLMHICKPRSYAAISSLGRARYL